MGVALEVSTNVVQRGAQPDTTRGGFSLDNATLKESMTGALDKNFYVNGGHSRHLSPLPAPLRGAVAGTISFAVHKRE